MMVQIRGVSAKSIKNSRGEKTIQVSIKTNAGNFSASAPIGKSTGKHEVKPYKKSLTEDIAKIQEIGEYFADEELIDFDCLNKVEDLCEGHVGGNTTIALEYAVLKAIAKEEKKEVWELINSEAKNKIKLVGNCIGGGAHSDGDKNPDFQEFLLISEDYDKIKKAYSEAENLLKERDEDFKGEKNDESAWKTSLNEKLALDIIYRLKEKFGFDIGVDIAASNFYKRKKYHYKNPKLDRVSEEQMFYVSNLISNLGLFYVEDPFEEDDFKSFSEMTKKFPSSLIVGDDLTTTNFNRLKKAIEEKSISAIIVKPNQIGSLIEVRRVVELAKKHEIKIVFSHRSGETEEDILADLAFGFEADYLKCGISGKEREVKIKRLLEIEKRVFD